MVQTQTANNLDELALADLIGTFYADPLGFVLAAYPWGEKGGPLEHFDGPDTWQIQFLSELGDEVRARGFDGKTPVKPILFARGSGRGCGKTALVAWLVDWIMSTRPECAITVTANTWTQLETRTWAEIKTWTHRCITAHWFEIQSEKIYRKGFQDSWFATAQSCKAENSQSFAGQHRAGSSSVYIIDEGSTVDDRIYEVAKSGLLVGEPMMFVFGNVTRTRGQLYSALFGDDRDKWNADSIDARTCKLSNKEKIEEEIDQYGVDSDYVRVWIRGLAPRASDIQFIDSERVRDAQVRKVSFLPDDPLIAGLDVARGGRDANVMRFRRGRDARSIPPLVLAGELTRDSMQLASWVQEQLGRQFGGRLIDVLFVDSGFGGPIVNRLHQLGFKNVIEVNFANKSPDHHDANMRAYMWRKMKEFLLVGAIDGPQQGKFGAQLEVDLTGPGFSHRNEQLLIEGKDVMRERGMSSTNHGDGLGLTFAMNVPPKAARTSSGGGLKGLHEVSPWG